MKNFFRRLVVACIFGFLCGASVAQAEALAGHTYELETLHSQSVCGSNIGKTIRTRFFTYIGESGREAFFFMSGTGGLRFDMARLKSTGQSVSARPGNNRYDATARLSGDQMSITMIGTNPQGGQAKYQLRFSMSGGSCQPIDFKLEMGGCGNDGQDARADRCTVHSGRRSP